MSSAKRLVSIVIPCYNQGRFLAEAIESARSQTYPSPEIIVVDDGSTDETAAVARRYPDATYLAQRKLGAAAARNAGLRASRGEHIIFLDADDRLLVDAVTIGLDYLSRHPALAFVTGHIRAIAEDGSVEGVPPQDHAEATGYIELLRENYIWTPGVAMYRREALNVVGPFDPSAAGSADFELNLRLARRFAYACHHRVILDYRRHRGSMTADAVQMLRSAVAVRRNQRRHIRGNQTAIEACRRGISAVRADFGTRAVNQVKGDLVRGRVLAVVRGLLCLARYYPAGLRQILSAVLRRTRTASPRLAATRERVARRG